MSFLRTAGISRAHALGLDAGAGYLVVIARWLGATPGKHALKIRTIRHYAPSHAGIPFRETIIRQLAQSTGVISVAPAAEA